MANIFDSPFADTLQSAFAPRVPSGVQQEIPTDPDDPTLIERAGAFASDLIARSPVDLNFEDVMESQRVFDRYLKLVPKVRKDFKVAPQITDETLLTQMMTHDRNFKNQGAQFPGKKGGFVALDETRGHNPALAAAEHRAFVLDAVNSADTPLEGGIMAVALGAATPAYTAAKAAGLKKGSKPSIAQLVAGFQGATEAFGKVAGETGRNLEEGFRNAAKFLQE